MTLTIANLTGTDKQIAWAENIRKPILDFCLNMQTRMDALPADPSKSALRARIDDAMQRVASKTSAAFWINSGMEVYKTDPQQLINNIVSGRVTCF